MAVNTFLQNFRFEVKTSSELDAQDILKLFEQAGISKPNWSIDRMQRALKGSSVIVTAWNENELIGFGNAITDFAWIAYLSQLAVNPQFQGMGVGRKLLDLMRSELGEEVTLVVHSAEKASDFYQRAGFEPYSNVFRIPRKR